jgi:hypothetical protein
MEKEQAYPPDTWEAVQSIDPVTKEVHYVYAPERH